MADREFKNLQTQGRRHIQYSFSVIYAAGAPQFVEGDAAGKIAGSYLSMVQTGAGVLTITTTNPFLAIVSCTGAAFMVTPSVNNLSPVFGKPSQSATTGAWSVTVNTAVNAAGTHTATTPANGDGLFLKIVLRNSAVLP